MNLMNEFGLYCYSWEFGVSAFWCSMYADLETEEHLANKEDLDHRKDRLKHLYI